MVQKGEEHPVRDVGSVGDGPGAVAVGWYRGGVDCVCVVAVAGMAVALNTAGRKLDKSVRVGSSVLDGISSDLKD